VSRESELERLIRQQQKDQADGDYQRPEPAAAQRIDHIADRLDTQGDVHGSPHQLRQDRVRRRWECMVHGSDYMVPAPPSYKHRGLEYRCGECHRESKRRWRKVRRPWLYETNRQRNREDARNYRQRKKEAQ
jgi:hypothetical protein